MNNKALCSICQINVFNYSCPKCKNIKYCSLKCYTKHKEDVNDHKENIVVNKETPTTTITTNNTDINLNDKQPKEISESDNDENSDNEEEDEEESMNEDNEEEDEEESMNEDSDSEESTPPKPIDNSKTSKFTSSLNYFKKVTDQQFQQLDNSKTITSAVSHKKLQQLILQVDQLENDFDKIELLQQCRKKIPEFNEFILKVLATIGNLDSLKIDDDGNLLNK